jgi:N-acylneuraminate cytidylyltransferase
MIKLFVSDVDGTLTDGTVYYSKNGEELKQFSHRDGRAFHLLHHETNCKTMWVTSELQGINDARAAKLQKLGTLDYYANSAWNMGKVEAVQKVCDELGIDISTEVAFIGDDTNDLELMKMVAKAACPDDANDYVKSIDGLYLCFNKGGQGAVREFVDMLMNNGFIEVEKCLK